MTTTRAVTKAQKLDAFMHPERYADDADDVTASHAERRETAPRRMKVPKMTGKSEPIYAPGGTVPLTPELVRKHFQAERASRRPAVRAPAKAHREAAGEGSHAVLVLPDSHHPFEDKAAMRIVEIVAGLVKPERVVILGDWLDAAGWSRHPSRSRAEVAVHDFAAELESCGAAIDRIQAASGAREVAFVEGNHEARVEAVCLQLGPLGAAVYDMVSPRRLLTQGRPWLKWIPYSPSIGERCTPRRGPGMGHYKITPDLWAVHGWSIATHAAAKHMDLARTISLVHGHTHRQQSISRRILETGRVVKAWSPGCLSELQPAWRHALPTDWVCGFSLVYVRSSDRRSWTDYTVTIDRGSCVLPGGTSVRA